MVRQKYISKHSEWMAYFDVMQDSLQPFEMYSVAENRLAMIDHLGDKHNAVRNVVATKVHVNPKLNVLSEIVTLQAMTYVRIA